MPQSPSDQALLLTRQALDDFDNVPLSVTIRRCLRIARLRGDWVSVWWLDTEAVDTNKRDSAARKAEMAAYFAAETLDQVHAAVVEEYINTRRIAPMDSEGGIKEEQVLGWSVEQLEAHQTSLQRTIDSARPPAGMHPQDLYSAQEKFEKLSVHFGSTLTNIDLVLSRVRRRVWDFLTRAEQELGYGAVGAEVFADYRAYVDRRLIEVAPEALDQLQSAYARVSEGTPEARAQAVLSCRRVLKSVADVLYPPTDIPLVGPDGVERQLTDDRWVSRLWQFVVDRSGDSRFRKAIQSNMSDLGSRIDAMNDLTSKGVHEAAEPYEVQQAVIQTYVLIGDLLRLGERDESTQTASGNEGSTV